MFLFLALAIAALPLGVGTARAQANNDLIVFTKDEQLENISSLRIAIRHSDVMATALEGTYKSLARWSLNSGYPEIRLAALCGVSQQIYCGLKYYDEPWDGLTPQQRQKIKIDPKNSMIPGDLQPGKQRLAIHYVEEIARLSDDAAVQSAAIDMLIQTMRFNRDKYDERGQRGTADAKYDPALSAENELVNVYQALQERQKIARQEPEKKALQVDMDQIRMAVNGTAEQDTEPTIKTHIAEKIKGAPGLAAEMASRLQPH